AAGRGPPAATVPHSFTSSAPEPVRVFPSGVIWCTESQSRRMPCSSARRATSAGPSSLTLSSITFSRCSEISLFCRRSSVAVKESRASTMLSSSRLTRPPQSRPTTSSTKGVRGGRTRPPGRGRAPDVARRTAGCRTRAGLSRSVLWRDGRSAVVREAVGRGAPRRGARVTRAVRWPRVARAVRCRPRVTPVSCSVNWLTDPLCGPQPGRSRPRIAGDLFLSGKLGSPRDESETRLVGGDGNGQVRWAGLLRPRHEGLFDQAVFQRVVGEHGDPPAHGQRVQGCGQRAFQRRQLAVHFDTQRLEGALGGIATGAPGGRGDRRTDDVDQPSGGGDGGLPPFPDDQAGDPRREPLLAVLAQDAGQLTRRVGVHHVFGGE